jgi:hypothetical protein
MTDDPVRVGDAFCFASTTGEGFGVVLHVNVAAHVACVRFQRGNYGTIGLDLLRLWRNALAVRATFSVDAT